MTETRSRYSASITDFFQKTRRELELLIRILKGKNVPLNQIRLTGEDGSWVKSLPAIADVLERAHIGGAYVDLEFNPPQYGQHRADVVVSGYKNGRPSVVVVELKQWKRPTWDPSTGSVANVAAFYNQEFVEHPVRQAQGYADMITHFISGFHPTQANVEYCAFLHNSTTKDLIPLRSAHPAYAGRTFAGDSEGLRSFIAFLGEHLDDADGSTVSSDLNHNEAHKSTDILEAASNIFQDPQAFPLSKEQRNAVGTIQSVIRDVQDPRSDKNRALIVVKGKPGSGKTWICLNLLGREASAGTQVSFATNSTSLRETLRKIAKSKADTKPVAELITSSRTFWRDTDWDTHDLLIVDEAQRLNEYTVRTGQANRKVVQAELEKYDITQLKELTKTAKVVVLMMDEGQQTTANDYVTPDVAKDVAEKIGAYFTVIELSEQHRSGGSKLYESWVDSLVDHVPHEWNDEENFLVKVADTPLQMEEMLQQLSGETPRILAGFCWPWTKKNPTTKQTFKSIEEVPNDIKIGAWERQWNLNSPVDGYPKADFWAFDEKGARQIGSIFTGQGFEFDYVGVIIGDDLVARENGKPLEVDITKSEYTALIRKAKEDSQYLQRFRNGYRVLLTRGMKGVVIYSTDERTRALLKSLVNPTSN